MQIPRDSMLLRIFLGEADRRDRQPLYEATVLKAPENLGSSRLTGRGLSQPTRSTANNSSFLTLRLANPRAGHRLLGLPVANCKDGCTHADAKED
jgi:hypothetical protein